MLIACVLLWSMGFAAMSLGIVAFADEHGNRLIAGVLEMVAAIGSLTGGLVGGALPGPAQLLRLAADARADRHGLGCVFATSSVVGAGDDDVRGAAL